MSEIISNPLINRQAPLHSNLANLSFLLGTWRGKGSGKYSTIKPFEYGEEIKFWHSGKPCILYNQVTWNLETGQPLHSESGYLRAPAIDKFELVVSQPTGIVSIEECSFSKKNTLKFSSVKVDRTSTAKHPWVQQFTRSIDLTESGSLHYIFAMQTEDQPLQDHLEATLQKIV